jgi:hypothetical protein
LICPNCGSSRSRRGGGVVWTVYMVLIALALPLVLYAKFNAAIFAGVMLAVIVLTHLVFRDRICLDCGEQWRPK